jgi:uncharacterized RDD family membrane protein YckC
MALIIKRIVAYIVDGGIAFGLAMIPQLITINLTGIQNQIESGYVMELWVLTTISPLVWSYFILMEASDKHATFGKRLLGLQVQSQTAQPLTPKQIIGRTGLKLLPWEMAHVTVLIPEILVYQDEFTFRFGFIVVYGLIFIYLGVMIWQKGKRAPYDMLLDTAVVPTKGATAAKI